MAKYSEEMVKTAAAWVEKNGLFPQPCGASVKSFCEAMDIDDATYRRWLENADFADALTRARDLFREQTVREVENALVKAAKGYTVEEFRDEKKATKVTEYDAKTGKKIREYTGDIKPVKSTRVTYTVKPDIDAAKFVLTNMEPERWKQKQEVKAEVDGKCSILLMPKDEIEGIGELARK